MTWDSVPWFVGGGAQHSPEIARLLAYAATSGAEGIITPGDLKVAPLDVPGTSVRVLAGACLILNRAAGGAQQTYVGRNPSQDVIAVPASGSGAGRSHLIVAQVEDPFMPGTGYQNPSDVTVGPYIFTRLIPDVQPSTTDLRNYTGRSAIPLARIDVPANTGTITASMIKDLRKLARARSWSQYGLQVGTAWDERLALTDTSWKNWPNNSLQVDVPSWATHALVTITLNTVVTDGTASDFNPRINFGGIIAQSAAWDFNGGEPAPWSGAAKMPFLMFAEIDVRSLAGSTATLRPQAARTFPEHTGLITFDPTSQVIFDVRFQERAV